MGPYFSDSQIFGQKRNKIIYHRGILSKTQYSIDMNWYKKHYKQAFPAGKEFTAEEISRIKDLVLQGKSFKEIGKIFNVSRTTISKLNSQYKWRKTRDAGNRKDFSDENLKIIKELLDEGNSFKEVGELFGVSRPTIQRLNDKYKWREKKVPKDLSPYVNDVVKMHDAGASLGEISRALGNEIGITQVRMILIQQNRVPPDVKKTKEEREEARRQRAEKDKQIAYMYLSPPEGLGMTMKDIAEQYLGHSSHMVVRQSLIRSGLGDKIRTRDESANLSGGLERQRQRTKEWWANPENREKHTQKLREIARRPENRQRASERTQKWWDENEWAKEYWSEMLSPIMKKRWEEMPGEPGEKFGIYLTMMDSREKAISCLNGFVGSKYRQDPEYASAIKNKYMQIINNHTYPNEQQQVQPLQTDASSNWYKRYILSQQVIDREQTYLDIGHESYEGDYKNAKPNIMWVLMDGGIAVAEESDMTPTHQDAFPFIDFGTVYYGRYEPTTERLSIQKPIRGVRRYRDIPMRLISLLDQKFNEPIISIF